jgi:23S rRNA (cytosine1962-C5)-methyltransferase
MNARYRSSPDSGPRHRPKNRRSRSSPPAGPPRLQQRPLAIDPAGPIPAVYVRAKILHPLLYRKRVDRAEGAQAGDLVAVYDAQQALSGYGIYNPRSEVAVRMLWHGPELPDDEAWQMKLERAVALRHDLLRIRDETDAYRLVHGEADGLSGLVVDRLGDVLSAEVFSLGMYQRTRALLDRLGPLCGTRHSLIQACPGFVSQEGCQPTPLASAELPAQVTIQEYGTRFRVRFEGGHKTGFFCDQRENRKRLAEFSRGKQVLDLCCYTGGFAVQAARLGQAAQVTGVDLDHVPLALARENANLNQVRAKFVQADAFAYMRDLVHQGRQFDVVVLDPPKLIRSRAELEEGTRKHFALNRLAMQLVRPGGILLSCSCAGLLQEHEFVSLLVAAARRADTDPGAGPGRELRILAKSGAAPDHPVAGNCLETEYLKAVWMVVD